MITGVGCDSAILGGGVEGYKLPSPIAAHFRNINFKRRRAFFVAFIQLREPALLSTAQRDNGRTRVDPLLARRIITEQRAMIQILKKISPEIRILYEYRMVLNALSIVAPQDKVEEIQQKIKGRSLSFASEGLFRPPQPPVDGNEFLEEFSTKNKNKPPHDVLSLNEENSVSFIQSYDVHKDLGFTGKGVRIGIIDTGIDYTHAALGGSGKKADYLVAAAGPQHPNRFFPNKKVVGGKDFVGTQFAPFAPESFFQNYIPIPDDNPIDFSGHGTHVAGTIAGVSNHVAGYSGVAPDAYIYALKVFGDGQPDAENRRKGDGGTSESAVLAALEFAADPDGNLDPSDQLDILNLSLGSGWGQPYTMYSEAITNLVKGGVAVVAAAGNWGAVDYILSQPAIVDDAFSVAWSSGGFRSDYLSYALKFQLESLDQPLWAEYKEAHSELAPSLESSSPVSGELQYVELLAEVIEEKEKQSLRGKIAVFKTGLVPSNKQIKIAAEAGALALVVVSQDQYLTTVTGSPLLKKAIPTFMIPKQQGQQIIDLLSQGKKVTLNTQDKKEVVDYSRVDKMAALSSKGPRLMDSHFKPEITAPGIRIISAKVGSGHGFSAMSGSSTAAPHISGALALLKQAHPRLEPYEHRALLMSSALPLSDQGGNTYPLTEQGAGRVRLKRAIHNPVVLTTRRKRVSFNDHPSAPAAALSLGVLQAEGVTEIKRVIQMKNITDRVLNMKISLLSDAKVTLKSQEKVQLLPYSTQDFPVTLVLDPVNKKGSEIDGYILFTDVWSEWQARMPFLAVHNPLSRITATVKPVDGSISSVPDAKQEGSLKTVPGRSLQLSLRNDSTDSGRAYIFNKLYTDDRKTRYKSFYKQYIYDLESVGWRILKKESLESTKSNKDEKDFLQMAFKIYNPVSRWRHAAIYLDFFKESTHSEGADERLSHQILQASDVSDLNPSEATQFAPDVVFRSVLLEGDGYRNALEQWLPAWRQHGIRESIIWEAEYKVHNYSTIAVAEVPLDEIQFNEEGKVYIRAVVIHKNVDRGAGDPIDQMDREFVLTRDQVGVYGMPEVVELDPYGRTQIELTQRLDPEKKDEDKSQLIVYTPDNLFTHELDARDQQSQSLEVPRR